MKTKCFGLYISISLLSFLAIFMAFHVEANASMSDTKKRMVINAYGKYGNWNNVSNVAQFKGPDGTLYYAIDSNSVVSVYKTNGGKPSSEAAVNLKKIHPTFGTVTCDSAGNFYLVTGETNSSDDTSIETVFISKYDRNGNHIKTTGDNGSSSYWYYKSFFTKEPFHSGNCDAAIHGRILSVIYARKMYNGHQSCSIFSVNIDNMSKVNLGSFYESHSFAQRVASTSDGFSYMSEGDASERAFTSYNVKLDEGVVSDSKEASIFDFWEDLESHEMYGNNENFAHMGGLAVLSDGRIAFAAQSAKSLNTNAVTEKEDVFIQIFDPFKDLNTADAFTTVGERSGHIEFSGKRDVTNYGVQWLTSLGSDEEVITVQIVTTDNKEIVVLYEYKKGGSYKGVYFIVMDEDGKVKKRSIFNTYAMLNPCVMPVYTQGKICWIGNKYGDAWADSPVYIYSLDIDARTTSVEFAPLTVSDLVYNGYEQELVTPGISEGGWLYYAVTTDKTTPKDNDYSESLPAKTNAGNYYVWYKVVGDNNHTGTKPAYVEVKIDKIDSNVTQDPISLTWLLISNGKAQNLVIPGEAEGGEMYYAVTKKKNAPADKEYKSSIPTAVNSGTYYVWFKVKGDENHNDSPAQCVEVTVAKGKDVEEESSNKEVTPAKKGKSLTDKKTKAKYVVTSSSKKNPTVSYSGSTNKKATSITVPATVKIGGVTYKVTEISARAFKGNSKLKKAKIGKNITKIGDEAFYGCTSLESLTVPAKTINVGKQFVGKCKKMKTLIFKSTKLTKKTLSSGVCKNIGKKVTIKVPKNKVTVYTKLFKSKGLGSKVLVKADK